MTNILKKTISIPESVYSQAKLIAASRGENFSSYVTKVLDRSIKGRPSVKKVKNPLDTLGQFSIGIKQAYKDRGELYDDYLRRKMGL